MDGAIYWTHRNLRWIQSTQKTLVYSFWAVERGGNGGLLHVHSLIGNVSMRTMDCGFKLPPGRWGVKCCLKHSWQAGIARVMPYDSTKGAAWYVAKYVTKELAEWGIEGNPVQSQASIT